MNRRSFLHLMAAAPIAGGISPLRAALSASRASEPTPSTAKIGLGMDNYAVRAMGWKAPALIEYAAGLKLDALLISDLNAFESLEEGRLQELRRRAHAAGLTLYVGSWSICPTSTVFKNNWGTAEEHLRLGLRAARAAGSPVFRAILGNREDRKTPGGIQARIADTVKVLKACRTQALDTGVKIAMENHGGDLHSWELKQLIEEAGRDFVGANIDSGNAAWTLEDPLDVLENVGPYTICSSLRDDMIWLSPEGATVQWTAAGEGLIDWKAYVQRWSQLCPKVPIIIETISGIPRSFPYKTAAFWQHYDRRPEALARFEALAKRGRPLRPFTPPEGPDKLALTQTFQKAELERSLAYLRDKIGLGQKR